jgi:hypothetical protein
MGASGARTEHDQPTEQLVAPAVGDRCITCDAPLVSDQRYCLRCGERRGKAPFSFQQLVAPPAPSPVAPAAPRRPRASSGATLVAGIATLLLAMGVGVLIGHNGNNNARQAAAPPQVITVGGAGAGASNASNQGSAKQAKQNAKSAAKVKAPKVVITKQVQQQAAASAAKVLGGGAPKQPTIQPGQTCVAGQQGCTGGKFTGNFFGGG